MCKFFLISVINNDEKVSRLVRKVWMLDVWTVHYDV
jgi:hypothetical protein